MASRSVWLLLLLICVVSTDVQGGEYLSLSWD